MTALASMTGFARAEGRAASIAWVWELRSVNGRGLDLRFRLPLGLDAMEPGPRETATKVLRRGNVTASLSVRRESEPRLVADPAALEQVLGLAMELHQRLPGSPVPRAEALLALPGVCGRLPLMRRQSIAAPSWRASHRRWMRWLPPGKRRVQGCPRRSCASFARLPSCGVRPQTKRPASRKPSGPG